VKPTTAMFRDSAAVETYSGDSAYGPIYAASVTVLCKVSMMRQLVRNAAGDEVVSEMTLYVFPADEAKFTPESRVTFSSRISTVLSVAPQTARGVTVVVKVTCS
jgi:hypothetical protein